MTTNEITEATTAHQQGDHSLCPSSQCAVAHAVMIEYREGEPCKLADCDICGRRDETVPSLTYGPQL